MDFASLVGERVRLQPLKLEHAEALFECSRSPLIWENLPLTIHNETEMRDFVQAALTARESGESFPYAVYDKKLDRLVGTTRYLRISKPNRNLNIGWTWYTPDVWRTMVNTECKYLLLKNAFETWKAVRVELITTTTHSRSQAAIERLGAKKEGVLRKKYNGLDYVVYSILDEEWPEAERRLLGMLQRS
ncbi:N-acetyltransferase [Paenibacillus nanensis]|uniref:N-acetyltransferase n=1 Tax=Paenibacillus nanensis TaxID=393251 RepID=A0A3A1UN53_9BACL|nr:GNAT family protein [Paenibacillus nanensis]RIX49978.1 N-acetyltransferase [Paenibacillus nanensis]